jgi:hypothetical protein
MSDPSTELPSHVRELFDTLASWPTPEQCRKCGSKFIHVDTTFFSQDEKFWTVPLPVCPTCDLNEGHIRRLFKKVDRAEMGIEQSQRD